MAVIKPYNTTVHVISPLKLAIFPVSGSFNGCDADAC